MKWMYKGIDISQWIDYQINNEYSKNSVNYVEEFYYDSWYINGQVAKAPLTVSISITDLCNLNCIHCSKKDIAQNVGNISFENFRTIIDKLSLGKIRKIVITGGEPFLNENIYEFVKYIKTNGMSVTILSNLNVDKTIFENVLNKLDSKDTIQVSIDNISKGYHEIRNGGNFKKLENNCNILGKYEVNTIANMVITEKNIWAMTDVLKFCEEHQIKNIRFTPYFACYKDVTSAKDVDTFKSFKEVMKMHKNNHYSINIQDSPLPLLYPYFSYMKKKYSDFKYDTLYYRCPAGVISCEIDILGDIYPCTYLIGKTSPFGNIYKESIEQIWNSERMSNFRNAVSKAEQCQKCDQINSCMGGCKAESFMAYGTYDMGDNTCFIRRYGDEI